MSNISQNGKKLIDFVIEKFENNELTNEDMVQLIECAGGYINLMPISEYAKRCNMSYNGVKKFRKIVTLFNVKFVTDNY